MFEVSYVDLAGWFHYQNFFTEWNAVEYAAKLAVAGYTNIKVKEFEV